MKAAFLPRVAVLASLCLVLLLPALNPWVGWAKQHAASGSKAPGAAVRAAKLYVKAHFNLSKLKDVSGLRSHRDRKWALVAGSYPKSGKTGLWAAWLKLGNGRWTVKHAGVDDDAFGTKFKDVPCDIQPAFSEPYC